MNSLKTNQKQTKSKPSGYQEQAKSKESLLAACATLKLRYPSAGLYDSVDGKGGMPGTSDLN